ncbi:hypothetical protein AWC38_SpisGene21442 [Stylophora pistillata]|uniref:Integrase zinc-binding domain-containing protein n=1 Tax=Stylophora pistillata TaxID=50429 RepID=A0A2B4RDS3_STYPI|nr:hypothetical protein AWC38_SpisGene21442 [Stylophora pistillata]
MVRRSVREETRDRLVFGLRPSPSILGATIKHNLRLYKQSEPEMAEMLGKSLYVDDFITGSETDEEALVIYKKSKQIMAEGGFNLRKWNSNSRTLLRAIESVEKSSEAKSNQDITTKDDESYAKLSTTPSSSEVKNDTIVKALGLDWDTASDERHSREENQSDNRHKALSQLNKSAPCNGPGYQVCKEVQESSSKESTEEEVSLKATDLKEAEHFWIKSVQASSFTKEIEFLQREDHKSTPPTYVTQFGLYLQEGVVRCKGRLNNSPLPENSRKPILLPASHEFVQLLIKQSHDSTQHSGIRDTLTTLRERFWVLRGREAVKKFITKCIPCRKFEGMPYSSLPPNDLPDKRVSQDSPSTHVGLDLVGPLFIETKSPEVQRNESKFTRAVERWKQGKWCSRNIDRRYRVAEERFDDKMLLVTGEVEELIPGTDGRVRAAVVKTTSRDKRPVYLRRVVQHLIPIEVKAINEVTHSTQPTIVQPDNQVMRDNIARPRRTAAVVGEISRQLNSS